MKMEPLGPTYEKTYHIVSLGATAVWAPAFFGI
jgi:hypothetical protein